MRYPLPVAAGAAFAVLLLAACGEKPGAAADQKDKPVNQAQDTAAAVSWA